MADLLQFNKNKPAGQDNRTKTMGSMAPPKIENVGAVGGSGKDMLAQQQKQFTDIQKGKDFQTQLAQNNMAQKQAAEAASAKGAQQQMGMQSGLSNATQTFLNQTMAQTQANQQQQQNVGLATQLGQRADQATQGLIGLGQAKQQQEEQALDTFLQTADLTNADSIQSAKDQYKNIFGTDADFGMLVDAQWDGKKKKAFSDLTTHITTNKQNYFNPDTNEFDMNKVKNDAQVMGYVDDLWNAQNKGMPGPSNDFIESTLKTQMTTDSDIAHQNFLASKQKIINSDHFKGLNADEQANKMALLDQAEQLAIDNGLSSYLDAIAGTQDYTTDAQGNKWSGEAGEASVTAKDGTVTDYKHEGGKWVDKGTGKAVSDSKLTAKLDKDFKPEDVDFDATLAGSSEISNFLDTFDPANADDLSDLVNGKNVDKITGSSWDKIIASEEMLGALEGKMDEYKPVTIGSGKNDKHYLSYTNAPKVGTVVNISGVLYEVGSDPQRASTGKGRDKKYYEYIDLVALTGANKGKSTQHANL